MFHGERDWRRVRLDVSWRAGLETSGCFIVEPGVVEPGVATVSGLCVAGGTAMPEVRDDAEHATTRRLVPEAAIRDMPEVRDDAEHATARRFVPGAAIRDMPEVRRCGTCDGAAIRPWRGGDAEHAGMAPVSSATCDGDDRFVSSEVGSLVVT